MRTRTPFGIRMANRQTGKPVHLDISDLPMKNGTTTNRILADMGNSYQGMQFAPCPYAWSTKVFYPAKKLLPDFTSTTIMMMKLIIIIITIRALFSACISISHIDSSRT